MTTTLTFTGIGATLYKLLTGGAVADLFLAEHDATMLEGVPDELVPVLLKATCYKPDRRFDTVIELARQLHDARKGLPPDPPDTPKLAMIQDADRPPHEPQELSQPTFPEIAEVLGTDYLAQTRPAVGRSETAYADSTGDEDSFDGKHSGEPALPYFMPQMDARKQRARGEKTDNSELPSYLDPSSLEADKSRAGGLVLGVDDHSRAKAQAAREAAMKEGLIDEHGRTLRDGEAVGEKRPGTIDDLDEEQTPWEIFVGLVWTLLGALRKPIAAFSIPVIGTGLIVGLAIGTAAMTVNQAEAAARNFEYGLYSTLESESRIVEDLIGLGANDVMLRSAFAEFDDAEDKDRIVAAERLIGQLEQQAKFQLSGGHSGLTKQHKIEMVRTRWDKISLAYERYSDAMLAWEQAADTTRGRMAVGVGAASAP